ncbi:MAG TPA: M48 family metallopeptidase [Gammaproteobacteria bacterium]|nr:M48 family metallopeptidase [Gammaproteobacteria bacterium]
MFNLFTWIFIGFLAVSVVTRLWLSWRQQRHVQQNRDTLPSAFADTIKLDEHQKAADYTAAKSRLGMVELFIGTAILLAWTLGGGLAALNNALLTLDWPPVVTGTSVILAVILIGAVLDLPLSLYGTFGVEARFGFNRTTIKTFIGDLVKGFILLLVLGVPLVAAALWFMFNTGGFWWLWVWALWLGFTLTLTWAYPAFIAPWFNKFSPLSDATLKQRIETLLDRCGFKSKGVYVMDGSKRSSHGNAYFTGVGNNKRIVFFDTLMDSLSADEIEAVLAHELGHFRLKHIRQRLIVTSIVSLGVLALLGWLASQAWFYSGLGVATPSPYMALLLFILAGSAFTFFLTPLSALWSRKHEFEADEYASQQSDAQALAHALTILCRDNASTLTPDPVHSAFYDSHPPAPVRIARLDELSSRQ